MKRLFLSFLFCFSSFLMVANAQDQTNEKPSTPKWVSDKGYWTVESNQQTPREATVYFYNNDHVLVYKEEIKNQKLKLNKTKTLLRLKLVLEEAVESYASGNWTSQNNLLIARLQQ
jgi:hypothetical protein